MLLREPGRLPRSPLWRNFLRLFGWIALATIGSGTAASIGRAAPPPQHDPVTIHVFHNQSIHFAPEDSSRYDTAAIRATQSGRIITRTLNLDPPPFPARITARVAIRPVPKDPESVHDKWDRAGSVRLLTPGSPAIELVKFITAYGGATEYEVDLTPLASWLRGRVTIAGFIDTWVSPAWRMDLSLEWSPPPPDSLLAASGALPDSVPAWVQPILAEDSWTAAAPGEEGRTVPVEIPPGTTRVVLHYLASGHCTDGRGAEEFEPRTHFVMVDGREVHRLEPWREDCKAFRSINPYCRRWSDGSWSADYARSGWCPGDQVRPIPIDLTAALPPGRHQLTIRIPGIRPRDADGSFGYWRVSGYLIGW